MSRKNKSEQSFTGRYGIPVSLIIMISVILWAFNGNWWWLVAAVLFFVCRWIYHAPVTKRRKEDIEWEKQYYSQKKKYKQEYEAKKKLLGSINDHASHEAYLEKYEELGIMHLEKILQLGNYSPKMPSGKKKNIVGSILYDYFLGTTPVEKKTGFSSTQSQGYTGESSGGQSAPGYGGGSTGGGGASN